ncbi:MAG: LuxR C-terminal-related transcriptional regulator [Planctomycetota bacterium]
MWYSVEYNTSDTPFGLSSLESESVVTQHGIAVESKPSRTFPRDRHIGTARSLGGGSSLACVPVETLVDVLSSDARTGVALFDSKLSVVWSNEAYRRVSVDPDHAVVGRSVWDLLPRVVAEERASFFQESLASMGLVRVHGMLAGSWTFSTYRAFVGLDGARRVLAVESEQLESACHPRSAVPESSRRARVDDWRHLDSLTERERQVLRLLGFGLSTQQIADRLKRSVKTVQSHREALGAKLSVRNKSELARLAVCSGLTASELFVP